MLNRFKSILKKMEIEIKQPVEIKMQLIETDDRLPSMKFKVDVFIKHPTGIASYTASDIWIDCAQWDKFVTDLSKLHISSHETALLKSLSEYFCIKVNASNEKILFELFCKEPDTGIGRF